MPYLFARHARPDSLMPDSIRHPLVLLCRLNLITCGKKPHFRRRYPLKPPDLRQYWPEML